MKRLIPHIDRLQQAAAAIRAASDSIVISEGLQYFLKYYDVLNYDLWCGGALWRARRCRDRNGFRNTAEVHYPPASTAKVGRLNEPGSPMLYTSFNKFTTFRELDMRPGEYLQVVGYSMSKSRPLRCLVLGEIHNVHKRGQGLLPGELSEKINAILISMPYEAGLSFVYMDAFLSQLLADPDSYQQDHVHSRALRRLLFEKHPGMDAIHYPSVALEGSMNLAVKPAVADEALRPAGTSVLLIEAQYDYGLYRFRMLRNARSIHRDGTIDWEDMS